MQNSNGIAANEGTALRELSLDETEMVGGGFSWGGLVHNVEHAAGNVLGAAGASGGTGEEDEAVCIAGVEAVGLATG